MGFLDALLGGRRNLKAPAPDRLFAITTAAVELEAAYGLKHRPVAGIVFQTLATADFRQIVSDTEELLRSAAKDMETTVDTADDEYGFRWIILRSEDFDSLVTSVNLVAEELKGGGYGDRLLCAVFEFEESGRSVYFIYNFKRGYYYPFVPAGPQKRNNEREFQLQGQLSNDLPIEPELTRWFPLWQIPM